MDWSFLLLISPIKHQGQCFQLLLTYPSAKFRISTPKQFSKTCDANMRSCKFLRQIFHLKKLGEDKTWTRGPWTRGPWTPSLDRVHGPPVMDQVHGQFIFIFIRRFCTRSMDTQKQKYSQNRFDGTLSTNAHDWSQIFSSAYMMYTLLAHVYHQERNYTLQYKDSHHP